MVVQTVFQRYELKYLLTRSQRDKILEAMRTHMALDQYGRTTIRNLYFDTDNYRLVRRSIERPVYKEKLRIRSYEQARPESTVFVEIKKKYRSIVYKRRIALTERAAMEWTLGGKFHENETQISREVDYFLYYYETLHPVMFLSYEREAYYSLDGSDFRVTFDDNVLCRQEDLSLTSDIGGIPLLDEDTVLMEIKCSGGIPLWMIHILSEEHLGKTSFSKYGTAYQSIIYPELKEAVIHV